MGIIFFGTRKVPVGYEDLFVSCPSCEHHAWADAMVLSCYYHIYWIPMFPTDKEVNLICQDCGLKRYGLPLTEKLVKDYPEVKGKFKHPWYTYIGVGFLAFLVIAITIAQLRR